MGTWGNTGSVFNPEPLESYELVVLSREGRERLLWTLPRWGQKSPTEQKCLVGVRRVQDAPAAAYPLAGSEVKSKGTVAGSLTLLPKQNTPGLLLTDHHWFCYTGGRGGGGSGGGEEAGTEGQRGISVNVVPKLEDGEAVSAHSVRSGLQLPES